MARSRPTRLVPQRKSHGSTRPCGWHHRLPPNGDVLDLPRVEVTALRMASSRSSSPGRNDRHSVPTYRMPNVAKLSAGYYARRQWISSICSSARTLGVIIEAALRVIRERAVALIRCDDDAQAVAVTGALRGSRLPPAVARRAKAAVSAIEHGRTRVASVPNDVLRAGIAARRRFCSPDGADRSRIGRCRGVRTTPDLLDSAMCLTKRRSPHQTMTAASKVARASRGRAGAHRGWSPRRRRGRTRHRKTAGDMVVPFSGLPSQSRSSPVVRAAAGAIWGASPTAICTEPDSSNSRMTAGEKRFSRLPGA